jgi:hypothetical protein
MSGTVVDGIESTNGSTTSFFDHTSVQASE